MNTDRKIDCSAVIVSGGLNSRMGGRNKAFLQIGEHPILSRLLNTLEPVFEDILLVTRNPEFYAGYPIRIVTDIFEDRSSLTGIHSGLTHAVNENAFIVPCDAPFIQPDVVRLLLDEMKPENDIVIPHHDGYYEPLCAIYSKRCLAQIESQLTEKNYRIFDFFDDMDIKRISRDKIQSVDPGLISFFNVNTPDALAHSRRMAEEIDDGHSADFGAPIIELVEI